MEGVLEAATALCTCKLAFSLVLLPRLPTSRSPVSFCCCCLLLFSDLALTAFLAFLCVSKSWPSELTLRRDVVALRFLLFQGRVYGVALLLTCPLVTLETLGRLRRARTEAGGPPDAGQRRSEGVGFLCCLSVWVVTALDVRWRWMLEEVWASACLHTTSSLLTCLPGFFSLMSSSTSSCVALTFLLLLLLLLLLLFLTEDLRARCRAPAATQGLVSVLIPGPPQALVSADLRRVDPEKTVSSSIAPKNSVHVSVPQRGDATSTAPERFPAGQNQKRTKGAKALAFMVQEAPEERDRCVWYHWGFPCPGLKGIIGLVGVLCLFVLPLILSVNIVLVQTVDYLMELAVRALLVCPAAGKRSTLTSGKATGGRSRCQHRFQGSGFPQARRNLEIC